LSNSSFAEIRARNVYEMRSSGWMRSATAAGNSASPCAVAEVPYTPASSSNSGRQSSTTIRG
jgi:hypothetical protein